jgi:hypothetical protein
LLDLWIDGEYNLFTHYVDHSLEPLRHEITATQSRNLLEQAQRRIPKYAQKLIQKRLKLDNPANHDRDLIFMVEESRSQEPEVSVSFHAILWELLADVTHWDSAARPKSVSIIRVIRPQRSSVPFQPLERCFQQGAPIRVLLVIGRNMKTNDIEWKENVAAGLIQQPLMQVVQHLDEIGHNRRVELEILRPSTLDQLTTFLAAADDHYFDIIHLDMHGKMKANTPNLRFSAKEGHSWVPIRQVAEQVCKHTKLLVMNACNTSGLFGGPGSAMVRILLQGRVTFISSPSFRLLVPSAQIFYPAFYMSLFLRESFHDAVTVGRKALQDTPFQNAHDTRNHAFVQSVYSNSLTRHILANPVPSSLLRFKAFVGSISFWLRKLAHLGAQELAIPIGCNYTQLRGDFENVPYHVRKATGIDMPLMNLTTVEIEYRLHHSRKKSVYVYPHNTKRGVIFQNARNTIRNMARVWIKTNFVTEVHVISVPALINSLVPTPLMWFSWKFFNLGHTVYRRERKDRDRRLPLVKRMVIVEEADLLLPPEMDQELSPAQEVVMGIISHMAQAIREEDGDLYLVLLGIRSGNDWNLGDEDWEGLSDKWSAALEVKVLREEPVKLATFGHLAR